MNLQQILISSAATYSVVRFITEDAGLKKLKTRFTIYAQKIKEQKGKMSSLVVETIFRFIMWPYWTALIILPIIYLLPMPVKSFLAITGIIYYIYDQR